MPFDADHALMPTRRSVMRSGAAATVTALCGPGVRAAAPRALAVSTTVVMRSANPYAHSFPDLYSIWSQVYGTLTRYNYRAGRLEPLLARSWSALSDRRWRVELDPSLRRHDGGPACTARDALHTFARIKTDQASVQGDFLAHIAALERIGDYTFDIVTTTPFAQFPDEVLSRVAMTSADLYARHGSKADTIAPFGWGPYALRRFEIDNRIVLSRSAFWRGRNQRAPATVVFKRIVEPDQRLTAVLNDEVQIARQIPPQMMARVRSNQAVELSVSPGLEFMFLGMNLRQRPFGDVRVRRAVAHAVDRRLIVDKMLFGMADLMDGAISGSQDCHRPTARFPAFDPARSRALLAQAGYPNGVGIDFYTASGAYVLDRQIGEAIAQMLENAGFRVRFQAPSFETFRIMLQKGQLPLYYTGRSTAPDPMDNLVQYYEPGASHRTNYANPAVGAAFAAAHGAFRKADECRILGGISQTLVDEAPSLFLWTHRLINAKRRTVGWQPDRSGTVWLQDVVMQ